MADYSDLVPANLKPGLTTPDGQDLKPSLVTPLYTGGTPTAADQIKPSLQNADGSLKPALVDADDQLKPGLIDGPTVENLLANGQFTSGIAGWSSVNSTAFYDATGGRLALQRNYDGNIGLGNAYQAVATEIGTTYRLQVDISHGIAGQGAFGASNDNSATSPDATRRVPATTGSYDFTFVATAATTYIKGYETSVTFPLYIDNVILTAL